MSANRDKGTRANTAVVRYLQEHGFPRAERRAQYGAHDRGDVTGVSALVCIEVKDVKRDQLAAHVDETTVETRNAHALFGALWHKRRGKGSPGDWFVTMTGEHYTRLLRAALGVGEIEDVA